MLFQRAVCGKGNGVALVDAKAGELFVRVRQDVGVPGGIGQCDVTQHRLPGRQFFAAVHLLVDAQNAVNSLHAAKLLLE